MFITRDVICFFTILLKKTTDFHTRFMLAHMNTKCSKVSFCDHLSSDKRHFLINHVANFDETSQERSFGGALLKLVKRFIPCRTWKPKGKYNNNNNNKYFLLKTERP